MLATIVLLGVAAGAFMGLLATFEPRGSLGFRTIYSAVAALSIVGIAAVWLTRRSPR